MSGSLRVYLGASPGVGKTFAMLTEGVRRAARGTDVVVGVVETHGRAQTAAQLGTLEVVPRRAIEYRGATLLEMDLDAILARRPDVVLVDEYAHTNIPGSKHDKRWQDVEKILDAGIDVITTVNVQHLESLNDVVNQITGTTQRETIPDVVVRRADQIELIDMSPEAIRRRMAHGNIYADDKVDAALGNYFRPGNLGALRELALLWLADRVDEALHGYRQTQGITDRWETRERVVVGLTGVADGEALVRRASRMAGRLGGELLAVHVVVDDGLGVDQRADLEEQRQLVRELGGEVYEVVGTDAVSALVDFARSVNASQLVIGASRRSRRYELLHGSFVARLARRSEGLDVHVIAAGPAPQHTHRRAARRTTLEPARIVIAAALTVIGLPLLTAILTTWRDRLELSTVLLTFLTLVLIIAAIGGWMVAIVAAVGASLLVNWFFVEPFHTFTITQAENVVALAVFVVVAVTVGRLVDTVSRRAAEAQRSRRQAEALGRAAASLATDTDPLPRLLAQLRATFDLDGVRLGGLDDPQLTELSDGDVDGEPSLRIDVSPAGQPDAAHLDVFGPALSADEQRVMRAVADQLRVAVRTRRLAREAGEASTLADIDAVRTGMLRAVSHDLRTPLASIKAMVSGLRDPDVHWSAAQLDDALGTVEAETDRLDRLVGNLLDASRLQSGALAMTLAPMALDEAVFGARRSVDRAANVTIDLPADLPPVVADAVLLERSLANLLGNALRYNPPDGPPVRIDAAAIGDAVDVRIVDHGPGIAAEHRHQVVAPFQRLGDEVDGSGVGLGLSIANGFVEAMGGTLSLDDTPGGGLTATVVLPAASEERPCRAS